MITAAILLVILSTIPFDLHANVPADEVKVTCKGSYNGEMFPLIFNPMKMAFAGSTKNLEYMVQVKLTDLTAKKAQISIFETLDDPQYNLVKSELGKLSPKARAVVSDLIRNRFFKAYMSFYNDEFLHIERAVVRDRKFVSPVKISCRRSVTPAKQGTGQ